MESIKQLPEKRQQAWNVYQDGKLIDTVFYVPSADIGEVYNGLVSHDGYSPDIKLRRSN